MKKQIIVIEKTKEKCVLKTDGKTDAADVADMILAAFCIAGKHLVEKGAMPAKTFKEVAIRTIEREIKEPESEGEHDG